MFQSLLSACISGTYLSDLNNLCASQEMTSLARVQCQDDVRCHPVCTNSCNGGSVPVMDIITSTFVMIVILFSRENCIYFTIRTMSIRGKKKIQESNSSTQQRHHVLRECHYRTLISCLPFILKSQIKELVWKWLCP